MFISFQLPGHFFIGGVHVFVSLSFPSCEQSLPPFEGSGLLHNLSRVLLPFVFPHVIEQSPQGPHFP